MSTKLKGKIGRVVDHLDGSWITGLTDGSLMGHSHMTGVGAEAIFVQFGRKKSIAFWGLHPCAPPVTSMSVTLAKY